jgi:hypothetical protein
MTAILVQPPGAREVRVRLRRARRGHHEKSLGDTLTDVYVLAWFVLMYGFVLVQAARGYLHPSSGGRAEPAEQYWIGVAVVVAAAGLLWQALRAVGPLLVTPPAQTWFVSTPVDRRGWLLPRLWGLLAAVAVVASHFARVGLSVPAVRVAPVLAVAGLPLAGAATVYAFRALPRLDRAVLTGGAQLASAAVAATTWLDPSLLSGVLEVRRWRKVGRVSSRRFRPWGRVGVLVQADLRRQFRRPSVLIMWGVLVLAQYATAVAVPATSGIVRLVLAYVAADRLTGGLRTICRSPGLRRAIGGNETTVKLAHLVVPALGTVLWWLATVPAGAVSSAGLQVVLVAGVVAAVYRAGTRPPMAYGGATIDTPFGLIPVDLLRQIVRGPDVLAVLILIQSLVA